MKQRQTTDISKMSTEEINAAFEAALSRLEPEDREMIETLIQRTRKLKGLGELSALELVGKLSLYLFEVSVESGG